MDIKTLCLGGLIMGDASGYDLKKQFENGPFAHIHHASFGSIYPALAALQKDGLITCCEEAGSGRLDKKTYSITDAGRAAFCRDLKKYPAADRLRSESLFMLFFAEFLDEAHLKEVFEGYLKHFQEQAKFLDEMNGDCLAGGRRFVHGFGRAFYNAAAAYMDENRDLILKMQDGPADTGLQKKKAGT